MKKLINIVLQGAIVGIVISHVITTWVTIGHIIYDDKNVEMLPLSIEVSIKKITTVQI